MIIKLPDEIKKLVRVALITSPIIGALISISPFSHISFSLIVYVKSFFIAVAFCLVYWTTNIFLVYLFHRNGKLRIKSAIRYILSYIINVSFFLVHVQIVRYLEMSHPDYNGIFPGIDNDLPVSVIFGCIVNSIIMVIQESIIIRDKKNKVELENAQLKMINAEAYYQELKQHIHPHFLFNSLNILKSLIKKNPDVAIDYVVRLSDFLRMSISSNKVNAVTLEDELKLCFDYLEMQKMRFGRALEYSINISEEVKHTGRMPVFAIQLLLENAIKHNSLTNESPLKISVYDKEGFITVCNNVQSKLSSKSSTGFGLANLSERYKMLSDTEILINSNQDFFSVTIKIL